MRSALGAIAVLMPLALLAGCATQPEQHAFENSRTYKQSYDQTWNHLLKYLADNNIQVRTERKATVVVYAQKDHMDFIGVADCGKPGVVAYIDTTLHPVVNSWATLDVAVAAQGSQTKVTVDTKFQQEQSGGDQVSTTDCTSTGALERQILGAL